MQSLVFLLDKKQFVDGVNIRHLLRRRGLRQKQVARMLRISESLLFQYLEAKFPVATPTLAALCKILELKDPSLIVLKKVRDDKTS